MFRTFLANTMAKKTTIFAAVFAITCILMGGVFHIADPVPAELRSSITQGQAEQSAAVPVSAAVQVSISEPTAAPIWFQSQEYPATDSEPVFSGRRSHASALPMVDLTALPAAPGFSYSPEIPMSYDLQKYTYNQCVAKGLEYELILALMWRESRFQTDAVGHNTNGTQDSGIMQINDVNKSWLLEEHGINNLLDPVQNIRAGTIIFSDFADKYGMQGALMAYQYGETGMRQKYEQGIYTNDKIELLMDKREDFRAILQQA